MRIHLLHLGNIRICSIVDATTPYSAGAVVKYTGIEIAIGVIDSHWTSPFWAPDSMQFDQASAHKGFNDSLSFQGVNLKPIHARRHNKNVIESKNKVVRDIFLCTKSSNSDFSEIMAAQKADRISNYLYGCCGVPSVTDNG